MSGQHTPTPWFHRQAGVIRHGEAYDWVADHPEQGRHRKIIVQRHACLPEDYAFIVEAVNSYDSNRATIDALVGALEQAKSAVSAAFEQVHAEYHDNWKKQDKCDELIRAWRSQADSALLLARGSKGDE